MKLGDILGAFNNKKKLTKGANWLKKKLFPHTKNITYDVIEESNITINSKNLIFTHNYLGDQEVASIIEIIIQKEIDELMKITKK